jgi:hypothetical protein
LLPYHLLRITLTPSNLASRAASVALDYAARVRAFRTSARLYLMHVIIRRYPSHGCVA